jgi:hypothetical protein
MPLNIGPAGHNSKAKWPDVAKFAVAASGTAALLLVAGCSSAPPSTDDAVSDDVVSEDVRTYRIAAAGDIACSKYDDKAENGINPAWNNGGGKGDSCRQKATGTQLLDNINNYDAVLPLGDNQYFGGDDEVHTKFDQYKEFYGTTWGVKDVMAKSYPTSGNHDHKQYYYDYFNQSLEKAGQKRTVGPDVEGGQYSYDLGNWHMVSLNSWLSDPGDDETEAQLAWLETDLAASTKPCTLAYWHEPAFTSNDGSLNVDMRQYWSLLSDRNADVVLNGHAHAFEAFKPQDASGNATDTGITELLAGTGGKDMRGEADHREENSIEYSTSSIGLLEMNLNPDSFDWKFAPTDLPGNDMNFTPGGSKSCNPKNGSSPTTSPTGAPTTTPTATPPTASPSSPDDGGVPSQPTDVKGRAGSHQNIHASWDAPDNTGGSPITKYHAYAYGIGDSPVSSCEDTDFHCTIDDLPAGTYTVKVAATNTNGQGLLGTGAEQVTVP